jgi:hypothetical protein
MPTRTGGRRRLGAGVLGGLTAVGVLAGCGGASKLSGPPPVVVTKAVDGIGKLSGFQAVVRIAAPASSFASSHLSPGESQAVLASRLVVVVHTPDGRALADEGRAKHPALDVDVAFVANGNNLAEIRAVGHKIYGRVDLPGLGTQLALPDSEKAQLAHAQSVLQADGTKVPGLANLAAGQWVDLPTSQVISLGTQELSRLGTPLASSTLQPATLGRTMASFLGVVRTSAAVDNGPAKGGGESYSITLPVRNLVSTPLTTLAALAGTFGNSAAAEKVIGPAEGIPGALTVQVDVVVAGRRLTQIALPLGQLAPNDPSARDVQVIADFTPASDPSAPSPATPLDLVQLFTGLSQRVGAV